MATTAKTRKDVEQMNPNDRLWDSLNHSYGLEREEIGRNYDKAYSQADRQALSRGMQRSSYNAQNLANINEQRNNALDKNYQNQIADYENRLTQQEQLDRENERWERTFAENQRQFDAGQQFQREENALNRAFQTSEREAQQGWQSGENALNRAYNTSEREAQQNWQSGENALGRAHSTSEREAQQAYNTSERLSQQQFTSAENAAARDWQAGQTAAQQAWQSGENALNRAYNSYEREAQQAWQSGENALNRAFNTSEREAQQNWQSGENERNRAYNTAEREAQQAWQSGENAINRAENAYQFDTQMAFNQAQADRSADQWERSFAQDNMTADQKLAASYVSAIIANGGVPSDALLARAGLSREDANAMAAQSKASASSGGPGPGDNPPPPGENPPDPNDLFKLGDFLGLKTIPKFVKGTVDSKAVLNWINNHSGTPESQTETPPPHNYKDAFEGQIVDKSQTAEERFPSSIRDVQYTNGEDDGELDIWDILENPDASRTRSKTGAGGNKRISQTTRT